MPRPSGNLVGFAMVACSLALLISVDARPSVDVPFAYADMLSSRPAMRDTIEVNGLVIAAPFLGAMSETQSLEALAEASDMGLEAFKMLNGLGDEPPPPGTPLITALPGATWPHRHGVVEGERIEEIARQYGLTATQLRMINGLRVPTVQAGDSLVVPLVISGSVQPLVEADSVIADRVAAGEASDTTLAGHMEPQLQDTLREAVPDTTRADSHEAELQDTDSVSVALPDAVSADTLAADTAFVYTFPDSGRVARYLQPVGRDYYTARFEPRERQPLHARLGNYWRHEIRMDSTGTRYIARELVGEEDVRYPLVLDFREYLAKRLEFDTEEGFRRLSDQRAAQAARQGRRGFGVNIMVPGGRESAFSTIFGAPTVDLRVNGQANINAGFAYQQSDQTISLRGKKGQLDPDFEQNIRLSITGTIGDKLTVDVNWDTERTFDFQNRLSLRYQGYEDEIIQLIEAGNVFLDTPSQLIQGGQSLFGIKTQIQLGGITLTTVTSQQEGESEEINLEGGSQTTEFEIRPTDYEDNQHFFLGYFFKNWWNRAFEDPQQPTVLSGFDRISDIEVWRLERTTTGKNDPNVREAIALVDLGEQPFFTQRPDSSYLELPGTNELDYRYSADDLNRLRENTSIIDFLTLEEGLDQSDFQVGDFRKLQEGRDYDVDELLGYISLRSSLTDDEALAVAYKYPSLQAQGNIAEVGDFSAETSGRLVLKLLRKANHNPNNSTWLLTMRNIYNLRGRGFSPTEFELDIVFERPGQPATRTIPGQRTTLLQLLGLDRLTEDGRPASDNKFDFEPWLIDPQNGRLIFPYREPFSAQIATATDNAQFIFSNLYKQKRAEAIRDSQHDVYRIRGGYKSSVQSVYNIPSFGIVEGSVVVSSGGAQLTDGTDYIVDYSTGTVTITNEAFLAPGRDVRITYEQSSFAAIQKKTLLGMRADYVFQEKLALGATMMRLSEKPLIDKFRIGEEPMNNLIWGVDGSLNLEPRWLTQAIDRLPLIQTRAPSSIQFKGEFAQLLPGSPQTLAFRRTRDQLRREGLDFKDDELQGISYIDDFESVENSISLRQQGAWNLSSAPDSIGAESTAAIAFNDSLRTTYRGMMAWYTLPLTPERVFDYDTQPADNLDATRSTHVNEVFPNKDVSAESAAGQRLQTFDMFFDPGERGPYNYTTEFDRLTDPEERKKMWGGMMQRLPEGYTDFNLNNIEFIEFIFTPHSRAPGGDAGEDAKLLIDIGSISEDVIPNEQLNTEDGLSLASIDRDDADKWSRLTSGIQDAIIKVDETTGRSEDLGFDGYPSTSETTGGEPYEASEQTAYADFIAAATSRLPEGDPIRSQLLLDPSADDYYHYLDEPHWSDQSLYPDGVLIQQRYSRFFGGLEMNSFEGQREVRGNGNPIVGNSNIPDTEDLNANANLDTDNSYFQYEIPLSREKLDELAEITSTDDFVVNRIDGVDPQTGLQSTWYTVRIPVRDPDKRAVGGISDFTLIRTMRMWTTGHAYPVTMRFASLDLVGSQWQKSRQVGCTLLSTFECQTRDIGSLISISTINNEESQAYRIPNGAIRSKLRLATGIQDAREQSLVLRARDLGPKDTRAIFKPFNTPLNLLKYGNMRMFVHGHGDGFDERGDVNLFIRLGLNEDNDYYEFEQPITPSDPLAGSTDEVWQTNIDVGGGKRIDLNSLNIDLREFNKLKVERDDSLGFPKTREFVKGGYDFTAPGAKLKIKGNPSLSGVTTMVIGFRGDSLRNQVVDELELWLNELRVTEFDSEKGWAGLASAQIALADLARIDANVRTQTDGFGPLSSELGTREADNTFNWSLTTNFNLHKFLPERFGWNIPITYSIRDNQSTPRFSPDRGDIRLTELLERIEENEKLDAAEKQAERTEVLEKSRVNQTTRSFSIPISKRGSRSPILRNTIDGMSVNYSQSSSNSSNPSTLFNHSNQWSGSFSYRFQARTPRTFRPLRFIGGLPIFGFIGDLRMSYLPQSFNFSASANRNFSESQERSRIELFENDPKADSLRFETLVRYPVRENHTFGHSRSFQLNYDPFSFLQLGYQNNTGQSFRSLSEDTLFSVAWYDTATTDLVLFENTTLEQALDRGLVDESATELVRLSLLPTGDVLSRIINGTGEIRTERYSESFSATFDPRLQRIRALRWLTTQPLAYSGRFQWNNGPAGRRNTGAGVQNNTSLRTGLKLSPQDLWREFGFYQDLERAQRDAANRKRARRARNNQLRQQRKEIQNSVNEQRRLLRDEADSLRTLARAEIDTLLRIDESAQDSLKERRISHVDTLLVEARRARDTLSAVVDSLQIVSEHRPEERQALVGAMATARSQLDSLRAREDTLLKREIARTESRIDSLRSIPPAEEDTTSALTAAAIDSLVAGESARRDSLSLRVDRTLDSLIAQAAMRVDSLTASRMRGEEADSLRSIERDVRMAQLEEQERYVERLERLSDRGDLEDLLAFDHPYMLMADSIAAVTDSVAKARGGFFDQTTTARSDDGDGGLLGFIDPRGWLRRLVLAATGIRDLTLTYNGSWTGASSNVSDEGYNLFSAFKGDAPSLRYRLGLEQVIDPTLNRRLIADSTLRVTDRLSSSTQLGARASVSLSPTLRVDVTMDTQWDDREDISYQLDFDRRIVKTRTLSGTNQATAWSFDVDYVRFFNRQLESYLEDQAAASGGPLRDENGDGRIVLTNETLLKDFQASFIRKVGEIGSNGFLPFPLPNWTVNWTGLNSLPIFRRLTQSATLRHGYQASYNADYRSNAAAGTEKTRTIKTLRGDGSGSIVNQDIAYVLSEREVGSVRVNSRFQPLLSIDLTFTGGIQTGFTMNRSRSYALSTTSADVTSNATNELQLRLNWSKRGLRLPFIKRSRLSNTLRIGLTASRSENVELRYRLQPDLETYLSENTAGQSVDEFRASLPDEDEFLNPPPVASIRTQIEPQISYTFSNRVSADFFVTYENLQSEGSRVPNSTNVKGGFRVRVNIANN